MFLFLFSSFLHWCSREINGALRYHLLCWESYLAVLLLAKVWFLNCILFRGIAILLPSGFIETYIYLVFILCVLLLAFTTPDFSIPRNIATFTTGTMILKISVSGACILYIECDTPEYELFQKSEPKLPQFSDLLHSNPLFPHIEI
jgi:hypothetical protein